MPDVNPSTAKATTSDTFCVYLARQFIAKRGFSPGTVPEAARIATQSDIVLTYSDGMAMTIIAMIDREAHPGKAFAITLDELEAVGKACLKYCGRINFSRMPATIHLMEVGPASDDQPRRLGEIQPWLFSKVKLSAWVVDTDHHTVWTTAGFKARSVRRFVEDLLVSPREAVVARPNVAVAPLTFPILTTVLIAVLCATFAAEIIYGIGSPTGLLQPTIKTLVAFGALSQTLVIQSGEWYRLLSAPFLHVDVGHLAMNVVALFVAGRVLESLIGRAWFGVVYLTGALCGSLTSLAFTPSPIVSVGASGAIMGLFAAMLVTSRHFPVGPMRANLQLNALYVLIPSLLPLSGALQGHKVDYAAHFGGAIGGVTVGLLMLEIWSNAEPRPQWRRSAAIFAIIGLVALAYPITNILHKYPEKTPAQTFVTQLIPPDKYPRGNITAFQALDLIAQYPHDPRGHLIRASQLLASHDLGGAEREARTALREEEQWRPLVQPVVSTNLHIIVAVAVAGRNRAEAIALARRYCRTIKEGPQRTLLDSQRLCEM